MKTFLIATAAMLAAVPAFAATPVGYSVTAASASGWCTQDGCNNNNDAISNHYANEADGFRNYFSFAVPAAQAFTSATLSIWSSQFNAVNGGGTYNLYQSSAFSYDGFLGTTVLGSVSLSDVDNGVSRYIDIALNADGLAALSAAAGSTFRFSGVTSGGNAEAFGYTNGAPVAQLALQAAAPAAAVPEAGTWAMMVLGFGVVGAALRRRGLRTSVTFG